MTGQNPPPTPPRLLSLDVLRGINVALMILVNNAGEDRVSYPQLHHSAWNGCTLTDLVFPLFLFMVGASIDLSFSRRLTQHVARQTIFLQAFNRAAIIFAIGLLLNALPFFDLAHLRIYGVLQRIALCYAVASLIYLAGGIAASSAIALLCLAGYWGLMLHVRIPGLGLPGVDVPLLDPFANLASWLDRRLIPGTHLYHQGIYDPEGLLSTLPALANTLFGILAAAFLRTQRSARQKALTLLLAGILLIACGLTWSHSFPLNKRLWTSSYALFSTGISITLLALIFYAVDGPPHIRRGLKPWLAFGTNALTAYVFSELLGIALGAITLPEGDNLQQFLYSLLPHSLASPSLLSLTYSVLFVLACSLPILYLYRRKIFIRL